MGDPEEPTTWTLSSIALVTWEAAKAFLGLADADESDVTFLINSISERVKRLTGRVFVEDDYEEYIEGFGDNVIRLAQYPVTEVTALKIDSSRQFGDSTALTSTEYLLEAESGVIRLYSRVTPRAPGVIYCDYSAGYEIVPEHIQEAVFETISWNLGRFRGRGIGMESQSAEGVVVRPTLTIPPSAWSVFMGEKKEFV